MSQITSFRAVIELWSLREDMAAEIGVSGWMVSKWWQRDSIPADRWAAVLATSKAMAAGVTAEALTILAARETAEART
jgi:hypothetical protein